MTEIIRAATPDQVEQVKDLFREYADWLEFDLCFQGFEAELAEMPGRYAPPGGRLLLAVDESSQPVGCVGLRPLEEGICEMKRLYVRDSHKGTGLGRWLAEAIIAEAIEIGYRAMRLDTVGFMTRAIGLYESLGFVDIPAYCHNPVEGVRYLELDLTAS